MRKWISNKLTKIGKFFSKSKKKKVQNDYLKQFKTQLNNNIKKNIKDLKNEYSKLNIEIASKTHMKPIKQKTILSVEQIHKKMIRMTRIKNAINVKNKYNSIAKDTTLIHLTFKKLFIGKCTDEEIENFMVSYRKNALQLCINSQINHNTQDAFSSLFESYIQTKLINYEIWYLQGTDLNIYAFCLIDIKNNLSTIEIKVLCSHIVKLKFEGKKLGIFLLDKIYDELINIPNTTNVVNEINTSNNLLKIQPANPNLIPYYIKWKIPSINKNTFDLNDTNGYLIYGNINNASDACIINLSVSFKKLKIVLQILNIKELDTTQSIAQIKETLHRLNNKSNINYNTIENNINTIQYFTIEQFKADNTGSGWTKKIL